MRTFILNLFLLFLLSSGAKSQDFSGSIQGVILESGTNRPLEGAVVRIFSERDSTVAGGAEADATGSYIVEGLPPGKYSLVASMVGHSKATVRGIAITKKAPAFTADTLRLSTGEAVTDEIDINAERSFVEFQSDKKVYNIGDNVLDKGGNASDVLKKIPSVSVDQEGNISLRGSQNVKFMIDGKMVRQNPSAILEQTPAGLIEKVEIITNPGSKYEAEGEGGLINIVLKKGNELVGYAGQFSLGAGNRDKYNAGLSLNRKTGKFNIYGNYNYRDFDMKFDGGSSLENLFETDPKFINESVNSLMKNLSHTFKAGVDLYLNPKSTLGLSATYLYRDRESNETFMTSFMNSGNVNTSNEQTNATEIEGGDAFDASFTYNSSLASPFNTLTGEATIAFNNEDEDLNSATQLLDAGMNAVNNMPSLKKSLNAENNFSAGLQLDYVHPLTGPGNKPGRNGKDGKHPNEKGRQEFSRGESRGAPGRLPPRFETGAKALFRNLESRINGELFDYTTGTYVNDTLVTNNFDYGEDILAAYGIYGGRLGELDFTLGARGEMTFTNVKQLSGDTSFSNNYFDVFPSISASYNLSPADKIQADFSRRINRPEARLLVPFVDNTNPGNIRVGNPQLRPEYVNSFQLTYLRFFGKVSVNPGVYYRHTSDAVSRFRTQIDSVTTLTTFENLNSSDALGAELIASYQDGNSFSLNGSVNYSYNKLNGSNIDPDLDNSGGYWNAKLNAAIKIWYDIDLQLSYNFQGRRPVILGDIDPFSFFDAGVKKDFFNDALSVNLRFSDIFNKQKFDMNFTNDTFTQDFFRKRESRYSFLTLTYNFGSKKVKQMPVRRGREENRPPDVDF